MAANIEKQLELRSALPQDSFDKRAFKTIALLPDEPQYTHWLTGRYSGIGIRIQKSGRKFVLQQQVRKQRRFAVLGDFDALSAEQILESRIRLHTEWKQEIPKSTPVATLAMGLEAHLQTRKANRKIKDKEAYRQQFLGWFSSWMDRPIDGIGLDEVEARYTDLKGRGRRALTALRAVVTSAANRFDTPIITRRLHDTMNSNGNKRELPKVFDDDFAGSTRAVLKHIDAWQHPVVRMGNLIAAFTGLRKDNILTLRWKDINFSNHILVVHDHKAVKVLGAMRLPIPTHLALLLSGWNERSRINEWVLPGAGKAGHLTELRGVYDGDGGLNRLWAWGQGDDDPFTAHSWRRVRITAAENLLGISESTAKFLHGHKPSGVRAHYNMATLDAMRPAQEKLSDWLNSLHSVVDVC